MSLKKLTGLLLSLILLICICSCSEEDKVSTVADIAYNRTAGTKLLYVKEGDQYTPFLVLTDNYDGDTLLIRKDIMERTRRISEYTSFYENSEIDRYLNGEYYECLVDIKPYITPVNIEITAEDALGISGDETATIQRKVFLLSCNEVDINASVNMAPEGNALDYFKNQKNRMAYSDEHAVSWWLRTPNTYYLSCTYVVGDNNKIGFTNAYDKNGIRPAFCVEGDMRIELKSGIVDKGQVYVFSFEN